MFQPKPSPRQRKSISLAQGTPSEGGFKAGYFSYVMDSRMPIDALSDMTNVTLDQDNLPRPRPSLVLFGGQPLGTVLGVDTFIKIVAGKPEKWDISMQVIGGVGKIHVRKDGGTWVAATGTNSYSQTATVNFCQSGNRVFISNASDAMSYYDINLGAAVTYVTLSTPSAPTVVPTGLTGTNFTYYVRISANNNVGESIASIQTTQQVSTVRDQWVPASMYLTISWSAVSNATSYNIYIGDVSGSENYIASVSSNTLTFKDDGSLIQNSFKLAPAGNSTAGPILTSMWNNAGQLYGVGDINNPDYLWYDAGSSDVGDFSPFNGGGNVGINSGGDTVPVAVRTFRTGKGDSVVTVLSRGVAGVGKMHQVSFSTATLGGETIPIPNVIEANGQAGTVSSRAVLQANNSLWYPTGQDFKSTGTAINIQNILSTTSVSANIMPDVKKLNLSAMSGACGLVYQNVLYWALPVGATSNNQIWVKDLNRNGVWIMPWTISAKFMWLSEDNTTGEISHCVYDGTNILKFSRSVMTQDNGVAFKTRVASGGLTWADNGMTMASIQNQLFKLLQPSGTINIMSSGLDEDGAVQTLASTTFTQTASPTGWGQITFSDGSSPSVWSGDVGVINFTSKAVNVVTNEIDETLNQLEWEIKTDTVGCDYYLSSVLTTGVEVPNSYFGS
jgi:hypothetical protein